jgi:O-antigen/teichoic acid export membrane protein
LSPHITSSGTAPEGADDVTTTGAHATIDGARRRRSTTEPTDLRAVDRSLVRGVAWTGSLKVVGQAAAWMSTLVVARLLSPQDFSLYGYGILLLGLVQSFIEFGVGSAVVSKRELTATDFAQLNTVAVGFGAAGTLLMCGLAPLAAWFFRAPELTPVVLVLAGTLLVGSFRSVPLALLQRELQFRNVAVYDAAQSIALAALSVVLASLGFGYWTFVIAAVAASLLSVAMTVVRHPVPFARPDFARLRGSLTLGGMVVTERLAWFSYTNADFTVAGRMLGPVAAGVYTLAWAQGRAVVDKLAVLVLQVTPAIFSKVQHDTALLRRYFVHLSSALSVAFWPLTVGVALVSPEFVAGVLGAKWRGATVPLALISLHSSLAFLIGLCGQILLVRRKQSFTTKLTVAQLVVMPTAFVVGSRWGVTGIAAAWTIVHPLFVSALVYMTLDRIELPVRRFVRDALLPALVGCAVMTAVVLALRATLLAGVAPLPRLFALAGAGGVAYLATIAVGFRERVRAAVGELRRLREAPAAA